MRLLVIEDDRALLTALGDGLAASGFAVDRAPRGGCPDRAAGLGPAADDYAVKPFAFPAPVAPVHALGRRRAPAVSLVLRVGDLELDPRRFQVRRAGVPVSLTAKEFAILQYFMRHAGEVVTRTMLLESCWDETYDGLSNLVDVHVSRVRRKIDVAGAAPLLHTIRGAGFVLDERAR